jgi:hypothetical protein
MVNVEDDRSREPGRHRAERATRRVADRSNLTG